MTDQTATGVATERRRRAVSPEVKQRREAAMREAGKESRTLFTDAVKRWSTYTGSDGKGPSTTEQVYYQSFKRSMHKRLGIPQSVDRDSMTRSQILALCAMEEGVTEILNDGMDRRESRKEIKDRYAEALDALAAAHLQILKLKAKETV